MIFEIINFSDTYTLESKDFGTACIAALLLGEGQYAIQQVDGNLEMPIFLFGGCDEWFCQQFDMGLSDYMDQITNQGWRQIAECLDGVVIGNSQKREIYKQNFIQLESNESKKEWRDRWHEEHRSSLNNIGARSWALAQRIREIHKEG